MNASSKSNAKDRLKVTKLLILMVVCFVAMFVISAVVLLAVAMGVESSLVANVAGLDYGVNGLGLGVNGLGHGHGVNSIGLVNGLGLGLNGLGVNAYGLGSAHLGSVWSGVPAAVNIAAHVPAAVNVVSSPVSYAHQVAVAPHVAGVPQVAVASHAAGVAHLAGHSATYVAKTRGAVHTAPLAGRINSAASINFAPAPGTW